MKRITVVLVLLPCLLLALKLTEYDVDQSSAQVLSTGFNYHFGMTGGDVVSNFGNVSLNFERFRATLPSSYNVNLFGNLSVNFEQDTLDSDTSATDSTRQISYQSQWETKYNKYFISGKDFLAFAKLEGDVLSSYDYPATQAIIGLGYGRFVSATPLVRALRIEEGMLAQGVLLDSLPLGTLMSFARELAPEARRTYKERHYYWEREYYKSLESILRNSNLLHDGELGSAGSLIISDVLEQYISPRYYGYEVNAGLGYDLLPAYKADGRAAFASLSFDYAQPIGFRSQFIGKSNLRLPFTEQRFGKEIHSSLLLLLLYELNSTIDLLGTYQLSLDRIRSEESGNYGFEPTHQLTGTFDYLIVDHLVMSNSLTLNHSSQVDGLSAEISSKISFRFF
jgi:hypothetical protein